MGCHVASVFINKRLLLVFVHDLVVIAFAWVFSYALRLNFDFPNYYVDQVWNTIPWIVLFQILVFWRMGLYEGVWRFASLPDMHRIFKAVGLAAVIQALILSSLTMKHGVPKSILILDPILLLLMMGGSRLAYRTWREHKLYGVVQDKGAPVLVIGAGEVAVTLLKELERSAMWRVVGIIDDNPKLSGMRIHGIPVLGGIDLIKSKAIEKKVGHVVIAVPEIDKKTKQKIVHLCAASGLIVMTVPSFDDLISGKVSISSIRKIEVEDLLGRDPVVLDDAGLHTLIEKRVVMVTGAGGSIGSELCRQIAKYSPDLLVLFEISEFALYQLEQELTARFPELKLACMIGDVKDIVRLNHVLSVYSPVLVFHAAAYKHVPMMEKGNVGEALRNNVLGTCMTARACIENKVEKFVLVSTDKAVNPVNVMGATKRLAEMVCQALQGRGPTSFVQVRFGNVLGSSGSVIPKFREQIARGGPITVTHPEVTRYFMSIPEAAQLVMQAGLMGQGGEIFVLDMGESVKIADLAKEMIRLSGLGEDDIKIVFTGLRPGEKLYEELLADDEHTLPTPHPKLRIAQARQVDEQWLDEVIDWIKNNPLNDQKVKGKLQEWVEDYSPAENSELQFNAAGFSVSAH